MIVLLVLLVSLQNRIPVIKELNKLTNGDNFIILTDICHLICDLWPNVKEEDIFDNIRDDIIETMNLDGGFHLAYAIEDGIGSSKHGASFVHNEELLTKIVELITKTLKSFLRCMKMK